MRNIFFLFLAVVLAAALVPQDASAWCNSSYSYRVPLNINTTTNLTNYQIPFNLTYDASMNANFSDLLYCDKNDAVRPFWIELQVNNTWAYVWINTSVNNTDGTQGYIYFGNPTATSQSNGSATWDFFDDFSDGSCERWTVAQGTMNCSMGYLQVNSSADFRAYHSAAGFNSSQNLTVRAREYRPTAGSFQQVVGFISPTTGYNTGFYTQTTNVNSYLYNSSGSAITTATIPAANVWYDMIVKKFNNNFSFTVNQTVGSGILGGSYAWNNVVLYTGYAVANYRYDDIVIGKYQFPEPTLSIGAKESQNQVTITSPASDGLWYTYSLLPTITANCMINSFANMTGSGAFIATKTSNSTTWTNTSALTDGLNSVTITCSDSDGTNVTATRTFNYAASPTGVSSGAAEFNLTFTGNENNVFWLNLSKAKGVINATLNVSGYNTKIENNTNIQIDSLSYQKAKNITIMTSNWNNKIVNITFSYHAYQDTFLACGRIYKNGVAFGTQSCTTYTTETYFSEALNWNDGDSLELWVHGDPARPVTTNILTTNESYVIRNITIDTASSGSPWGWNYTGEFNSSVGSRQVNLNATLINNYLSSCTADASGYCQVPITAHSDTAGILQVSNITINDSSFLQVVNTTGQAISTFTANFSNGTYTKVYFTTTGLVVASLSELPSGATNLTITQDGYRKNDTITYTIDKTPTNTTYFNTTATLSAASVLINAYDEKSPSTAINFTVTFANSTNSKTWYNQTSFSQKYDNLTLGYSTITISSTGYATRNYYLTITPQTYEQINAYLMQTSQGQTVRFHYVTITNQAIQSVLTTAQKSINGVLTTVEQETSDSSGSSTLFLDPTVTYTITSTNAAYNTQVSSIQPSLQDYTIYLTSLSNTINISYQYGDVSILLFPTQTIIERHSPGLQWFNITVNSTSGALTNWGWNLTFNGTSIYSNQLTNAYGGTDQYLWDYTFVNTTTPLFIDTYFTKDGTTTHHYDMFSVGNISTGGNTLYDIFSTIKSGSTKNITALNGSTVMVTTAPQYGFMSVALILICLIINALVMSYVNQYTMTGAGMFGVMLLALEWSAGLMPGAIVTFAAIIVIAILVLRGYF